MIRNLFTRRQHLYTLDERHHLDMRLTVVQAVRFYWQAEGAGAAWRVFWWYVRGG